jgi:secreted trypsin-like serine protease
MLKKLIMTSTIIASSAAYAAGPVIVGGTEIHSNQYPFIVAVFNTSTGSNTEVDCAGTLVGKQWVLTASHCVSNMEEAGMPKVPAKDISIETRNAYGTLNSSSRDQASQAIIYGNANAFQMEHVIALIILA